MATLATDILLVLTTAAVAVVLVLATARFARRVELSRLTGLFAAALLIGWLGGVAELSHLGVFSVWNSMPPHWPLLPLFMTASLIAVTFTPKFRAALVGIPLWQPVELQVFRIAVELSFWMLYIAGKAPVQVTFEGQNFDVIVGLTAPLMAVGIARRRIGPRSTIAWNAFGLLILITTITTVATSVPGPLHRNWAGAPFTSIVEWPVIWIPAFLAPVGIFLHVVSIRQSLAALNSNVSMVRRAP